MTREIALRRLRLRSWRRGIKECDLILGNWADSHLQDLGDADLALYERMLGENDHDIYAWVAGTASSPEGYRALVDRIAEATAGIPRQA